MERAAVCGDGQKMPGAVIVSEGLPGKKSGIARAGVNASVFGAGRNLTAQPAGYPDRGPGRRFRRQGANRRTRPPGGARDHWPPPSGRAFFCRSGGLGGNKLCATV